MYLVTDWAQGGELFDRICAKGNYYERDAAHLVRSITEAVEYLHNNGIVHRGELILTINDFFLFSFNIYYLNKLITIYRS